MVKGRNEPHNIQQVLEIIAAVRGEENIEQLGAQIYDNTEKMFFKTWYENDLFLLSEKIIS